MNTTTTTTANTTTMSIGSTPAMAGGSRLDSRRRIHEGLRVRRGLSHGPRAGGRRGW